MILLCYCYYLVFIYFLEGIMNDIVGIKNQKGIIFLE